jgi:hypothetical protein
MRPTTIIYFERLMFATLAMGIVQTTFAWNDLVAIAGSPLAVVLHQLFTIGRMIALTLLVSRGGSRIVMWICIGMFALGLPLLFVLVAQGLLLGSKLILVGQAVGQFVAFSLLFTASARRWMDSKRNRNNKPGFVAE